MQHNDDRSRAALPTDGTWRKSHRSNPTGDCVEVAALVDGDFGIRNSRDPNGPALICSRDEMAALLLGAKDGEFDDVVA